MRNRLSDSVSRGINVVRMALVTCLFIEFRALYKCQRSLMNMVRAYLKLVASIGSGGDELVGNTFPLRFVNELDSEAFRNDIWSV